MKSYRKILIFIVIAQFFCTSLWFAGNGIIAQLIEQFELSKDALAYLTSSVQFGFITGTLLYALLTITDRFSPSKVFMISAFCGAVFNLGVIWDGNSLTTLLVFRFLTGFFLAGIYPVGMKIATDYFDKGLGKSLGFLVGALVIGTAFPHLLSDILKDFSWKIVLISTSVLATIGGLLIFLFVPDGPFRKAGQQLDLSAIFKVFKNKPFRSAAFGYFGHMWELYTFWAFVPILLKTYADIHSLETVSISSLSFYIIAIGGVACVIGGYLSERFGTKQTAFTALFLSAICSLIVPFSFSISSFPIFLVFLFVWSMVVIADSPLFSTLVAQNAAAEIKGSALTIVNCIGFAITIISILILNQLSTLTSSLYIYSIMAIGPILGLIALKKNN
jgi:MFS family permease